MTSSDNASSPPRGPLRRLLDLFSSITLGIWLLALLFVYCTVGSAGVLYPRGWNVFDPSVWAHGQLRQWRPFEMTEFEWFHWWPFDLFMALICANIIVTTLRRIPLKPVNYGVWMIHTGILVLSLGSVWYFGTKIEGDSPVARRQLAIELPGGERAKLTVMPGNSTIVQGDTGSWRFDVTRVDPAWTIASGDDAGKQAYSVTVAVRGPGADFMRQLLAGYPEYTEDILSTDDPEQPMQRAVKALGRPLVDEGLVMALEYEPQEWIYLANWVSKSWALYLREAGEREWWQRPIDDLPLYNDYVGSLDEVWPPPGDELPLDPLDVSVPAFETGDPLADTDLRISAYLRYAFMRTLRVPGDRLDPLASVRLAGPSGPSEFELAAFDPQRRSVADGLVEMRWASSPEERERWAQVVAPTLRIRVPPANVDVQVQLDPSILEDEAFRPIEGTDFAYRVQFWQDGLEVSPGRIISMANVRVRTPEGTFQRWVTADPAWIRDWDVVEDTETDHASGHPNRERALDERIVMRYTPGNQPAPLTLVAGPGEDDLGLLVYTGGDEGVIEHPVKVGVPISLGDQVLITVTSYLPRTTEETRPAVVPMARRERDMREQSSMVKVSVPGAGSVWVPFHHYPFRDANDTLRRNLYRPAQVRLPDGRTLEMMLSRQRLPLPTPVALEDFRVSTHVGGFSGRVSSIRNWTSMVRFGEGDGWSEPSPVRVNEPLQYGGLWYFQAQWDPPARPRFEGDPPSAGLNFTVLGVGNRNGVGMQLVGCTIAVLGMLYAFYFKPVLRRRMRDRGAGTPRARAARPSLDPVGTLSGERP